MRLVSDAERNKKLTGEQTKFLATLIEKSIAGDSKFYKRATTWKEAIKGRIRKLSPKRSNFEIVANLAYAHLRTTLPTLFFKEPTVVTRSRNVDKKTQVEFWKRLMNALNERNGYKRQTKRCILDAIISAEGWKKIIVSQSDTDAGFTDTPPKLGRPKKNGQLKEGPQTEAGIGPSEWSDKMIVSSVWVPTVNVIVDVQTPGRDIYSGNCRFVAIRYLKNVAELRADPRYTLPPEDELDKTAFVFTKDGKASGGFSGGVRLSAKHVVQLGSDAKLREMGADEDMTWIYEVWVYQFVIDDPKIRMFKQMVVLMDGAEKPIRDPIPWDDLYGAGFPGWPIHKIELNEVPQDYPQGEIEAWYPLLQAVNWVLSRTMSHLDSSGTLDIIDASALKNPKKVEKDIKLGKVITQILIKSGRAQDAVNRLAAPPVQKELFTLMNPLITLMERVSGVSRNRQQQAGIRTATEARNIENSSEVVEAEKVDTVADFLKADNIKMAAVIKSIADSGYIRNLMGETGAIPWEEFDEQNVKWLPEFDIEIDSFRQLQKDEVSQKWFTVLNFSLNLLPFVPRLDIAAITVKWIESMGIESDEILAGLIDERILQMVEITSMMNGQAVEIDPKQDHKAHLEMIGNYKNTDVYKSSSAEFKKLLAEHEDSHFQANDDLTVTSGAASAAIRSQGQSPFDAIGGVSSQGIQTPQEGLTGVSNAGLPV